MLHWCNILCAVWNVREPSGRKGLLMFHSRFSVVKKIIFYGYWVWETIVCSLIQYSPLSRKIYSDAAGKVWDRSPVTIFTLFKNNDVFHLNQFYELSDFHIGIRCVNYLPDSNAFFNYTLFSVSLQNFANF